MTYTVAVDPQLVQELLDEAGAKYVLGNQSFRVVCPKCTKEKLYVYRATGMFRCFSGDCGGEFTGQLPWLLKEYGLDYRKTKTRLYGGVVKVDEKGTLELDIRFPWGSINEDYDDDMIKGPENVRIPVAWPLGFLCLMEDGAKPGVDYLAGRGIDVEVAMQYYIRYDPDKKAIIFPLSENGQLYGWQARKTGKTEFIDPDTGKKIKLPKAITTAAPGVIGQTLMFHDRLIGSPHAVLCEGPVDALHAHLCGGNVATLGKTVKDGQLEVIRRLGIKKVYIAMDPDATKETEQIAKKLWDLELYLLHPLPGFKDLGEMPLEQVYQQFLRAPRIDSSSVLLPF